MRGIIVAMKGATRGVAGGETTIVNGRDAEIFRRRKIDNFLSEQDAVIDFPNYLIKIGDVNKVRKDYEEAVSLVKKIHDLGISSEQIRVYYCTGQQTRDFEITEKFIKRGYV